ncbi:hypothetical protein H7J88_28305 [Mycolicibacterium flavescens]|uniref:Protein kinase n=1 Tax=Mycolicibacterium flavescens TaxID=1776 RepID=A0A1E3RIL7_MYCFV|nr:hypothetical protein [Mycolicibacterium flavescens]MCV7283547.1 hypothetical protein [Mycolicibacterium flavescens]ODQ89708.1 hypothetical protein BHQ18_12380 [Mycolicibacterium flavescens]
MVTRAFLSVSVGSIAAACSVLLAPTATAAPTSDAQGYVDSTARCAAPSKVVVFGSTAGSRVAICESADGEYQYRGVRMRDGAKLIAPATQSGDGYTAENDGITYTVTEDSLEISDGARVIREESMVDFHQAQSGNSPGASPPPATSTPKKPLPPPLPAEVGGS